MNTRPAVNTMPAVSTKPLPLPKKRSRSDLQVAGQCAWAIEPKRPLPLPAKIPRSDRQNVAGLDSDKLSLEPPRPAASSNSPRLNGRADRQCTDAIENKLPLPVPRPKQMASAPQARIKKIVAPTSWVYTGHPMCTQAEHCRGDSACNLVQHLLNGEHGKPINADIYCDFCWHTLIDESHARGESVPLRYTCISMREVLRQLYGEF